MRPINRTILRLALPSILANITVPLVGMVDIAVAGHLDASAATMIGGIAIGSMLFDLLYWNFGFLRAGTGGLTAQAFGRGDRAACARTFTRSVSVALGFALLLIAVQWVFVKAAFLVIDCSHEVEVLAMKYFFIRIWAAPATLSLMAFKGWFIGMQDSVSSMVVDLVVNVVNIAASIVLSLGLPALSIKGLGYPGIAVGTVVAQYAGLLTGVIILLSRRIYREVFAGFRLDSLKGLLSGEEMKRFFSVNADLFVRSLCFIAIYIGYTLIAARYGDLLLASTSILMKLLMLFSYFTDGFAYAGEALSGKAIGAGDKPGLRLTVLWTFIWSGAIALLFVFVYYVTGVPLLRLMTDDAEVVEVSRNFLIWLFLMPIAGVAAFTWDGIYVGATASRAIRNAMLWSVVAFVAVWAALTLIVSPDFRNPDGLVAASEAVRAVHILLAAYFAHLFARTAYLSLRYRKDVLSRIA
ncbi:MAG: MATE family efflux transporter [Bacteroidales bacterium]|nr:MATE family efflux transporter [Bacteroidales bacterium]